MSDERTYRVIAVDFDNTLFLTEYPDIVCPNTPVIEIAKRRRDEGDKLILWTCREGDVLEDAIKACRDYGLEFDAVNDNIPELKEKWGNNTRKVAADEYWDDHNTDLSEIKVAYCLISTRQEENKNEHQD